MSHLKKIKKEHIWLGCIVIGPLTAFFSVFYPAASVLGLVFIIIGLRGILSHIM